MAYANEESIKAAQGEWHLIPTGSHPEKVMEGSFGNALVEALRYSRELSPETEHGAGITVIQRGSPWVYLRGENWRVVSWANEDKKVETPPVGSEEGAYVLVHDRSDVYHPSKSGSIKDVLVSAVVHAGAHHTGVTIIEHRGRVEAPYYAYLRLPKSSPLRSKTPTPRSRY